MFSYFSVRLLDEWENGADFAESLFPYAPVELWVASASEWTRAPHSVRPH